MYVYIYIYIYIYIRRKEDAVVFNGLVDAKAAQQPQRKRGKRGERVRRQEKAFSCGLSCAPASYVIFACTSGAFICVYIMYKYDASCVTFDVSRSRAPLLYMGT